MVHDATTTSLRRVLTQPKPIVPCKTTACKNSKNSTWPKFDGNITVWEEFTLKNLNESYGYILDLGIPEQRLEAPKPSQMLAAIEVAESRDINYLIRWGAGVIHQALDVAAEYLNLHHGVRLQNRISAPDNSTIARINDGHKTTVVDHFIALDEYPLQYLVVGLGKPSSKFQGRRLADNGGEDNNGMILPLRQLAGLCRAAKTRYGYILTDEDLVVCCFSSNNEHSDPVEWEAALMPIPWSRHGENQLTTALALWWLSMLAMSAPQHRAIVRREEMTKINEWSIHYVAERDRWVRRHKHSNFEEDMDAPHAPPPSGLPGPFATQRRRSLSSNKCRGGSPVRFQPDRSCGLLQSRHVPLRQRWPWQQCQQRW